MSKICGECIYWIPSLTQGDCKKDIGGCYAIEVADYCPHYTTYEQNRISELEARHNEDMAEILNLYRILGRAGYDKTASGWVKVRPDKTPIVVDDGEIM